MGPVPDNGVCPGINHGVCKGFEKLCGFVTLPCPHLVSVQAHENHVGLAACFPHFCRNASEVPGIRNRLHVFSAVGQSKLNVSERKGAFRKGIVVAVGNRKFFGGINERHVRQFFGHCKVLGIDVVDALKA